MSFFFNVSGTTQSYTRGIVGSVRCVYGTGELRVGTGDHAGRATGADVDHRTHGVRKIFAPFLGGGSPTAFPSRNAMIDTRGPVPWGSDVPFHVRIVDE